jgi:hypothetical protein
MQNRKLRLGKTLGQYRKFFSKYGTSQPPVSVMLNDINQEKCVLIRLGCTMSLLLDNLGECKVLYELNETNKKVLLSWINNEITDDDLEDYRKSFIDNVLSELLPVLDNIQESIV